MKWLSFLIPSLWIHYAFSGIETIPRFPYSERFGGGKFQLELYYEVHPKGVLQNMKNGETTVPFRGFFMNPEQEVSIFGSRTRRINGQIEYFFEAGGHRYLAFQKTSPKGCEPTLELFEQTPHRIEHLESLLAAFCD